MSIPLPWRKKMAGSHHVKVRRPDRSYCFEAWAYPSHPLSRIPFLGPFFTFNLGHNPQFAVNVKYLGYESRAEERAFDSVSIPPPEDKVLWDLDLGLMIDGEYIEGGDVIQVDLDLTTMRRKRQRYVTRRWPLFRSGKAALQIEYSLEEGVYSFEVKDNSFQVTVVLFTCIAGIIGVVVGWLLKGL